MAATPVRPLTWTGTALSVVLLFPSWPLKLAPQAHDSSVGPVGVAEGVFVGVAVPLAVDLGVGVLDRIGVLARVVASIIIDVRADDASGVAKAACVDPLARAR
jgi:hypothetical protein